VGGVGTTRDGVDEILEQWARERPDLDASPMATFGRLARVAALATQAVDRVFARHGLLAGEFDVLATLRRSGAPYERTPTELARMLMLSPAGMTGRVDKLEAAGYVRRESDPGDRRSHRVVLTEDGRALVDALVVEHVANEAALLAGLSAPTSKPPGSATEPPRRVAPS
jgi:DNA-binding MarR family transcriptional regulator